MSGSCQRLVTRRDTWPRLLPRAMSDSTASETRRFIPFTSSSPSGTWLSIRTPNGPSLPGGSCCPALRRKRPWSSPFTSPFRGWGASWGRMRRGGGSRLRSIGRSLWPTVFMLRGVRRAAPRAGRRRILWPVSWWPRRVRSVARVSRIGALPKQVGLLQGRTSVTRSLWFCIPACLGDLSAVGHVRVVVRKVLRGLKVSFHPGHSPSPGTERKKTAPGSVLPSPGHSLLC